MDGGCPRGAWFKECWRLAPQRQKTKNRAKAGAKTQTHRHTHNNPTTQPETHPRHKKFSIIVAQRQNKEPIPPPPIMTEAVQEERRGKYPCSIRTKVSIEDFGRVKESAEIAGMSMCAYARHRLNGAHITAKYDLQVLNELRRIGGLLKKLAGEGQPTAPALSELMRTMKTLQQH